MAKIYYENDADIGRLKGRPIAIIGYGSQGHAHALNLKDSGLDVRVGLYDGSKSWAKAEAAGLRVRTVGDAAEEAQIIMILTPDTGQQALYRDWIAKHLSPGKTLMFAHGFNIRFGQVTPPKDIDVSLIAPKAPGHRVREVFVAGGGVPALIAVHQDASGNALIDALAYGKAMGHTRAGLLETTFAEETETDVADVSIQHLGVDGHRADVGPMEVNVERRRLVLADDGQRHFRSILAAQFGRGRIQ